jgi:hypothetical protein
VTINHVILPTGPGSWIKNAKWDEYAFTIQNQGDASLKILGFWLIDIRGVYLQSKDEPGRLETISEALSEEYATALVKTTLGLATAATSTTLLAGGAVTAGALAMAEPAVLLAIPFIPLFEFKIKEAKELEKEKIQIQFLKRKLRSFRLAKGAVLKGSQFFPVVPNPRELVVEYSTKGTIHEMKLPLRKLRGKHEELARKIEEEKKKREEALANPN